MIPVVASFALTEYRALLRSPLSMVFFFGLPAAISAILGSAVTGLNTGAADGRSTLGFAVMFAYISVNYVGRALYREYYSHTWQRTAIAAPPRAAYLAGKCFAVFTISIGQLSVFTLAAVSILDFPVRGAAEMGQFLLLIVLHAASGVAVGAALFTLTKTVETYLSITYLVLITFAALGGAIVASRALPTWSRFVGVVTPHHWAMRGFDNITSASASWSTTLESAAVLVAMCAVLAVLAVRRFHYQDIKLADI